MIFVSSEKLDIETKRADLNNPSPFDKQGNPKCRPHKECVSFFENLLPSKSATPRCMKRARKRSVGPDSRGWVAVY